MARACLEALEGRGLVVHVVLTDDEGARSWAQQRGVRSASYSEANFSALVTSPFDYLLSIFNLSLLPERITSAARCAAINYHDGPLPRYAGFHAANWAILNGERVHGVTWHLMERVADAGDIVVQRSFAVSATETALSLNGKCYEEGLRGFHELLDAIESGRLQVRRQDLRQRTFHRKSDPFPADGLIQWDRGAAWIDRLVRALTWGPYENPIATPRFLVEDRVLIVTRCRPAERARPAPPGTVTDAGPDHVLVSCGDTEIEITGLADLFGNAVPAADEVRSGRLRPGVRLPIPDDAAAAALVNWKAEHRRHESFWHRRLARSRPLPSLFGHRRLFTSRQRGGRWSIVVATGAPAAADGVVGPDQANSIAAFCVALRLWSGMETFDIGLDGIAPVDPALRPFVAASSCLHVEFGGDRSFARLRDGLVDDIELLARHGGFARDLGARYPELRGCLTEEHIEPSVAVRLEPSEMSWAVAPTGAELLLHLHRHEGRWVTSLEYASDVYEAGMVERLGGHLRALLEGVASEPNRVVDELAPMSEAEQTQVLGAWTGEGRGYREERCVHELVREVAERHPSAVAAVCGEDELTYGELEVRANQLAMQLVEMGAGPETLVGISQKRSLELVVGLLGILKAGGAYVPLEPRDPEERVRMLVRETGVRVAVGGQEMRGVLEGEGVRVVSVGRGVVTGGQGQSGRRVAVTADNLAYVVHTSGSTGRPKGVMVPHRAIVNYVRWAADTYATSGGRGSPIFSPVGFDLTVTALYVPLILGQTVTLTAETAAAEAVIEAAAGRRDYAFLKMTPSQLDVLNRALRSTETTGSTRVLVTGGEALHAPQLARWWLEAPDVHVYNEYGPTETTVGCTAYAVPRWYGFGGALPIGRPIDNTRAYVLDADLRPVPIGQAGELYIAGVQVARGYLGQAALTAERFVPDPFVGVAERMYRTGDRARWRPDGVLEFVGRTDRQMKLHGHRIEPGELEALLRVHPTVEEAAVISRRHPSGEPRLVAYVARKTSDATGSTAAPVEAGSEAIARWRTVFEEVYGRAREAPDPAFDPVGWDSSTDGLPIPADHLREWVRATVERIQRLRPRRVLEVGCGTGLLLFQLAPGSERYVGLDFSQRALDRVAAGLGRLGSSSGDVRLVRREAADLDGLGSFDVIVLNSIIQYLSDDRHLRRVLRACRRVLDDDGVVFVGDVRSLPLLAAFHAGVELDSCDQETSLDELRRRVHVAVEREPELALDPRWFAGLIADGVGFSSAGIEVKRGTRWNELTRFRYDVTLRSDGVAKRSGTAAAEANLRWTDWEQEIRTLERLDECLREAPERSLAVGNIPDARVDRALSALRALSAESGARTAGELRRLLDGAAKSGIDPEVLWRLAEQVERSLELAPDPLVPGRLTAVFLSQGRAGDTFSAAPARDLEAGPAGYANEPAANRRRLALAAELREHLLAQLPAYAVPSAIVVLDRMPYTPNGKVDHDALPDASFAGDRPHALTAAATTPIEAVLIKIWSDVLGIDGIGPVDNFFALGGDSILTIQVVARAKQAGLALTIGQLFSYPTVAELARVAEQTHGERTDGPVQLGRVPMTPVQHWFFEQRYARPEHFNRALLLSSPEQLEHSRLEHALNDVVAHHDVLRLRVRRAGSDPILEVAGPHEVESVDVEAIDLSSTPDRDLGEHMDQVSERLQRSITFSSSTLLRCALFDLGPDRGCRLLLLAHHLVVDAVSWSILAQDLQSRYLSQAQGSEPKPLLRSSAYGSWVQRLQERATSAALGPSLAYWVARPWRDVAPLPLDHLRGRNVESSARTVTVTIGGELTDLLVQAVSRAAGITVHDLLVASLAHCMQSWSGEAVIAIDLVGHGREDLFPGVDVSRTVGWFTALYPMVLDLRGAETFDDALGRVASELRRVPNRGIDYGILRYLASDEPRKLLAGLPRRQVCLNYEGQLDRTLGRGSIFTVDDGAVGRLRDPDSDRPYLIEVGAAVLDGRLRIAWSYSEHLHTNHTVQRLADAQLACLRRIVEVAGGSASSAALDRL
jgi:amino acid adenylation domain-containing protein/non-ribosomal peptide synthase protein (TIGR01720 family)